MKESIMGTVLSELSDNIHAKFKYDIIGKIFFEIKIDYGYSPVHIFVAIVHIY